MLGENQTVPDHTLSDYNRTVALRTNTFQLDLALKGHTSHHPIYAVPCRKIPRAACNAQPEAQEFIDQLLSKALQNAEYPGHWAAHMPTLKM